MFLSTGGGGELGRKNQNEFTSTRDAIRRRYGRRGGGKKKNLKTAWMKYTGCMDGKNCKKVISLAGSIRNPSNDEFSCGWWVVLR